MCSAVTKIETMLIDAMKEDRRLTEEVRKLEQRLSCIKRPVSPALEGGVKGHKIKGKYLTGKPPL
jgi:hypothetical protein